MNENTETPVAGDTAAQVPQTVAEVVKVEAAAEPQPSEAAAEPKSVSEVVATSEQPAPSPAAEPKIQVKPVQPPKPKLPPKKAPHKAPTDEEVQTKWKNQLKESGLFEGAVLNLLPQYATKHRGFDPKRSWGGTLISMFIRLGTQLKELDEFTSNDSETIFNALQRWLVDLPETFGEGPDEWNSKFHSSVEQRDAINSYFEIGGALYSIPKNKLPIMAVRRAAWPSRIEGEKKVGGTFGDRFNYLVLALVNLSMVPDIDIWSKVYHTKQVAKPDWVDDNMRCKECGEPVKITQNGTYRCTGLVCPNRFGTSTVSLEGFDGANTALRASSPVTTRQFRNAPAAPSSRRDRQDRRHEDDGERRFEKNRQGGKKHKKFRPVKDDDSDISQDQAPTGEENPSRFQTPAPAAGFGSLGDAFAGAGL